MGSEQNVCTDTRHDTPAKGLRQHWLVRLSPVPASRYAPYRPESVKGTFKKGTGIRSQIVNYLSPAFRQIARARFAD